jgi:hypothetical protein
MSNKYAPSSRNCSAQRQARVSLHRPGASNLEDITDTYAEGLRMAADALLKAIAALKDQAAA